MSFLRLKLPVALAACLCGTFAAAQEIFTYTEKGEIYLEQDGQTVTLPQGRAGRASDEGLEALNTVPVFMLELDESSPPPGAAGFGVSGCTVYFSNRLPLANQPLQADHEGLNLGMILEVEELLAQDYPPASVMLHGATMGFPMDRVLYAAVRAQPFRSEEFYDIASELYRVALDVIGYLPGWTCTTDIVDESQNKKLINVNDLESDPRLVSEVVSLYFNESTQISGSPNWVEDEDFHLLAQASELLELAEENQGSFWYRPGPLGHPGDTVLIGLYPDTGQVVIDATPDEIRRLQSQGVERIPVVFYFNLSYHWPISRFGPDATLSDVLEAFFDEGIQVSGAPLITAGDFVMPTTGEELEELFEIPPANAIDPERYRELSEDISQNGFRNKPVMATLLYDGGYGILDEPDRVRVAMDLGVAQFPVALFYGRLNRLASGAPAACLQKLESALICAGGSPSGGGAGSVGGGAGGGGAGGGAPEIPIIPPPVVIPPPPPASPN